MYNRHNTDLKWAFHRNAAALCTVILAGKAVVSFSQQGKRLKRRKVMHWFPHDNILCMCVRVCACVSKHVSWTGLITNAMSVTTSEQKDKSDNLYYHPEVVTGVTPDTGEWHSSSSVCSNKLHCKARGTPKWFQTTLSDKDCLLCRLSLHSLANQNSNI